MIDKPSHPRRAKITVLIPTCNEENLIGPCIESVLWADEVYVVDSFSADSTAEVARRLGARVEQHEFIDYAKQKNWAIPRCTHKWVLGLDTDERVTPELRDEILKILEADAQGDPSVCDGYIIYRLNHFLGRRVKYCGWQSDRCLRLHRRDKGRYHNTAVHAGFDLDGRVGTLKSKMLHYTFTSFEQYMRKFNRMTSLAARDRDARTPVVRWYHLTLRPIWRFFRQYILRGGILDGRLGLVICILASFSVFMKYAKLMELHIREQQGGVLPETGEKKPTFDPTPLSREKKP